MVYYWHPSSEIRRLVPTCFSGLAGDSVLTGSIHFIRLQSLQLFEDELWRINFKIVVKSQSTCCYCYSRLYIVSCCKNECNVVFEGQCCINIYDGVDLVVQGQTMCVLCSQLYHLVLLQLILYTTVMALTSLLGLTLLNLVRSSVFHWFSVNLNWHQFECFLSLYMTLYFF